MHKQGKSYHLQDNFNDNIVFFAFLPQHFDIFTQKIYVIDIYVNFALN